MTVSVPGIIVFLLVGLVAGWLAGHIMRSGFGLIGDLIVGVIGAIIGGLILGALGVSFAGWGILGSILVALIGAIILLFVIRLVRRI